MSLRCPVCGEAKWFNITSLMTFTYTEMERMAGPIDPNQLGVSPDDECVCNECGHGGTVSEFREYHEVYEKPQIIIDQLWDCMRGLRSINENVTEKDDCLGHVLYGTRVRMSNLLKNLEARVKKED